MGCGSSSTKLVEVDGHNNDGGGSRRASTPADGAIQGFTKLMHSPEETITGKLYLLLSPEGSVTVCQ